MDGDWLEERGENNDEGFADGESPEDDAMETNNVIDPADDELLSGKPTVYYTVQMMSENEQGRNFTKEEVEELMKSDAYQKRIATCHMCQICWFDGSFTAGCTECGGYGMKRTCPICVGKCPRIWTRNVKLSHSLHEARWEGQCALSSEEQHALMLQLRADSSEDTLSDGMQDLSTR